MSDYKDLQGLRVLNPRAPHQAHALNQAIQEANGIAINLPVIAIEALSPKRWLDTLPALDTIDLAIFTSANAVSCFFSGLKAFRITWPNTIKALAIGPATAFELQHYQIQAIIPEISNSEQLLHLPATHAVEAQDVLLVKGLGGRLLLPRILKERQSRLFDIAVYQRIRSTPCPKDSESLWRNNSVDIILGTSQFIIDAIFDVYDENGQQWLRQKPWVVFSTRLQQIAREKGIIKTIACNSEQIIDTLYEFRQGLKHDKS